MRVRGYLLLASLVLVSCGLSSEPTGAAQQSAEREREADELAAENASLRAQLGGGAEACAEQLEQLRSQLEAAHRSRAEREYAWFEYNRALALLELDDRVPTFTIDPDYEPKTVESPPGESPAEILAREMVRRAGEIETSLKQFLLVEEIRGIDLLELGSLDRGAVGPVVFRLLDDRGRLAGGLSAERMRLEASRAGHTVTLVLENGYESRGGERMPFESGVRRIVLPYVDPQPWIDSFPELFPLDKVRPPLDDGRWDRARVKREVNTLMREAAGGGAYHRLSRVEGILGDTLQLVQLEAYNATGGLERRLFADRMDINSEAGGVRITLTDGVIVRAGTRRPFVGGRHSIYLPGADGRAWEAARIPGLAEPTGVEDGPDGELER